MAFLLRTTRAAHQRDVLLPVDGERDGRAHAVLQPGGQFEDHFPLSAE